MISSLLEEIKYMVRADFGGLDGAQLNKRPAPDKWSIAQCLDHLIVSNGTYIPAIERVLSGKNKTTWWQRINPFKKIMGRKGIDVLRSKMKFKAPAVFRPSANTIPYDIIDKFAEHQDGMKKYFDRLEQGMYYDEVISSPVLTAVPLRIEDTMMIIVEHERRHLEQARGIKRECIDKK